MKRLLLVMIISFNLVGMQRSIVPKNTCLCLNTSPDFGTKHFIRGYKEKVTVLPIVAAPAEPEKKEKKRHKHAAQKKVDKVRGGAELIDKNCIMQVFFSSVHDLTDIIIKLMSESHKKICIAAFTLTEPRIVNMLIEKHKQGIEISVFGDVGTMKHVHSKMNMLINNNVPVWRYDTTAGGACQKHGLFESLMHHKFMTIDDYMVITGSANFTKAGHNYNQENIIVVRDKQITKDYLSECKRLEKCCIKCQSNNAE